MSFTFSSLSYSSVTADNFHSLPTELKDYFRHLAAGDPNRSAVQFFADTVPVDLQEHPDLVDKYLNGDPELGVTDKDWSHDVSRDNGGSDSADNGRFEDLSKNRSRGADNTTSDEQAQADTQSAEDVETLLDTVEEGADLVVAAELVEFAGSALEFGLDCFAPVVGGVWAAKAASDQFTTPKDKWGFGSLAGGAAVAYLVSPLGGPTVACYLGYKGLKKLHNWATK